VPDQTSNFRRILLRNIALPLALGVFSAAVFIGLIAYLLAANHEVERSDQVISRAFALQKLDLERESAVRGFLLTGDEQFLEPYRQAEANLDSERRRLREMVQDAPDQLARLSSIEALERRWDVYAAAQLAAKRKDPGYQIGSGLWEGKRLKDSVRHAFDEFISHERRLREQRTDRANTNTIVSVLSYVVLMMVVGCTLAWRGRSDLLELSGTFNDALAQQRRQAEALEAQAWLRERQTTLSEHMAREQELARVGHAALESLSESTGAAVGAVYLRDDAGGFLRTATWGWSADADATPAHVPADRTLLAECAARRRIVVLQDLPPDYLRVSSGLGEGRPASVLLAPIEYEGRLSGVVELGFLRPVAQREQDLLAAASPVLGGALEAARFRRRLQDTLEETQQLNEELQTQQEELRTANEELEEQSRALKESQAQLEGQQAELEQTNVQLSDQASRLEAQRDDLEKARGELEQRAQELQQASRYKSEFLANMSHELRTPLNSSLILAKLLADNAEGNLSAEQVKFAQSIYSAGNDLLNLINDILDIAKVEAGRLDMRPEVTPVAALTEGLRSMFQPLAGRKGLQLDLLVASDVPSSLYTDRQRLEQILRNLLSNAVKFTERGTIALHVTRSGSDALAFEVRDSGIGIDAANQELIFEAFRQADGTIGRRFGGTGLGLTISRDLARLLGGDITLTSAPGVGSTFTLILPLEYKPAAGAGTGDGQVRVPPPAVRMPAPPPPPPVAPQAPAARTAAPAFEDDRGSPPDGRHTVLVIEDDEPFARILFDLAHELGYRCLVAHQADAGIALAQEHAPDAALLDMRLPDGSGLSVLQRLKEDPRTRHIPVHVISVEDREETALHLGAIGYARKPASRDQLREVFGRLQSKLTQEVKRVLLVEDDPRQQESLRQLIADEDVEIVTVGRGADALSALAHSVFDLMVIDLALPDMPGQELLRRMATGESRSFPPVIVYTGRNLTRDEETELLRYSRSIIIKGARSPERLLDEVTLFLHQVENRLSADRQKMLRTARSRDRAFEGRRILVVDDDVRNIFALTSALEHKGAVVETARNGLEALAKLRAAPSDIDLVLMDIMMPEMDGFTATREIRKDPRWQKLPVIAVTAKAMKEDQQRCLEAGANDYLAKPIELERLFSLLRVWMPKVERMG
jgi:CheY-like chemotaxis protein/CHASE3 domain sensor protein